MFFGSARAGERIETDSLSITLPNKWKLNLSSTPASAVEPDGELLQLSLKAVIEISGPGEALQVLEEVERNAATAMKSGADDPELSTVVALKTCRLVGGTVFQEWLSRTKDGKHTLAQFSMRGPRSLVFATYEGPFNDKSLEQIRRSLEQVQWK